MLRAVRTLDHATLTLDFEGPGSLWLDRVSLVGEDAILGLWRADAVEAIRALQPGAIRFGGSAMETYEWDQCLGDPDRRAPFPQTYWGGIEENFVGVEEFVALCQAVGAEPLICVRWTGKSPADAAAEVEYFNGPADSPGGRRRAANGHPQPYAVKYWQIGNEVGGPAYDASVKAFAMAMRQADPAVKALSSFPSAHILQTDGGYLERSRRSRHPDARLAERPRRAHAGDHELPRRAGAGARLHGFRQRHRPAVRAVLRAFQPDAV